MKTKLWNWLGRVAPCALATLALTLGSSTARAYEIGSSISPSLTAGPIQVVYWIMPGVIPTDEARVLADIDRGLKLWENVGTACIGFQTNRVVHAATQPPRADSELLIIVGNQAELASGGAFLPVNGNPGTWLGAVADVPSLRMVNTAAHEVGHAIGFLHSSISLAYSPAYWPIMHFSEDAAQPDALAPDDVAAVSVAYPCASAPLGAVTGTVTGRLVSTQGVPVSGVNVVAFETNQNRPNVGRLSGQLEEADGVFNLQGLPPGSYRLEYRDGHSYEGSRASVDPLVDSNSGGGFQTDNFTQFNSAPFTVSAGQVVNLGDIPIEIFAMSIDSLAGTWLPPATLGAPYDLTLHVKGGMRDIRGTVTAPAGLSGVVSGASSAVLVSENTIAGYTTVHITGTSTQVGVQAVTVTLTDRTGAVKVFPYHLTTVSTPALSVDTGNEFACARYADRTLRCWGRNDLGQLGVTTAGSVGDQPGELGPNWQAVNFGAPVQSFALGNAHGCAVLAGGSVKCWGANESGELGVGDTVNRLAPVSVDVGGVVSQVSLGDDFSCARLNTGEVKCWGHNYYGQLGVGTAQNIGDGPGEMGAALKAIQFPTSAFGVRQIAAGGAHTCALMNDGSVHCWGYAIQGQLGLNAGVAFGDASNELEPPAVSLGVDFFANGIASGEYHSCALNGTKQMKCWGSNTFGELGLGDHRARGRGTNDMGDNLPFVPLSSISTIDARIYGTCALTTSNELRCWGFGGASAGQPQLSDQFAIGDEPGEVAGLPPINFGSGQLVRADRTAFSTSGFSGCAILIGGPVKCWGNNFSGELGDGDTLSRGYNASEMGDNLPAIPFP